MNEAQDKAAQALVLKDDEYFGLDEDRRAALSTKLSGLFPAGPAVPPGPPAMFLAAGAPRTVLLDRRHEIPLLIGSRYTGQREWSVHLEQNSVVIVADLKTGEVMAGWPFLMGKRRQTPPPSGTGTPPDEFGKEAVTTGVRRVDLRALFERTWITTRLAVSVVDYDWTSNVVVIDIVKEGPLPAEAKPRKPSQFLGRAAAAPIGPGATLSVPVTAAKGAPVMLKGSVDLDADRAMVAPKEGAALEKVLTVAVLFRKLDQEEPIQIEVVAPADLYDSNGVARVKAAFEFNAQQALSGHELGGIYQVYLVAGGALTGPYPLTVGAP